MYTFCKYLISGETNNYVFRMFTGCVALAAQSEITIALETFVHEANKLILAA